MSTPPTALPAPRPETLPGAAHPASEAERVRSILRDGTSPNTTRSYAADLRFFSAWCVARGVEAALPVPVGAMVLFVTDCALGMPDDVEGVMLRSGAKRSPGPSAPSTLGRRVAALSVAHDLGGHEPNPCRDRQVRQLIGKARAGAVRRGWAPAKKAAAHRQVLDAMLATCGSHEVIDVRDRALLLFGFSTGGRRRSEVVGSTVERLVPMGDEFVYRLGLTKTTQSGDAGAVPVAGVAARALAHWLRVADIGEGPIFRAVTREGVVSGAALSDRAVALVVKRRARLAGLDARAFSGHSLRSGFMTEAGFRNMSVAEAMALSKHRSVDQALAYYQSGHALRNQTARMMD